MTDEQAAAGREEVAGGRSARTTPAMRWVLVGVLAMVLIGAGVLAWTLGPGAPGARSPLSSASPYRSATAATGTTAGPLPDATPTFGSEVLPPTTTPGGPLPPVAAPPAAGAAPLVRPPFPVPGSADGTLVSGFPAEIMGPMPKSDIIQSEIATQDDTAMQVSLLGRTDTPAADVRAYYAAAWASLGLTDQGASDGSVSFAGRGVALSLSTTEGGTGIRYTIFGIFRAA